MERARYTVMVEVSADEIEELPEPRHLHNALARALPGSDWRIERVEEWTEDQPILDDEEDRRVNEDRDSRAILQQLEAEGILKVVSHVVSYEKTAPFITMTKEAAGRLQDACYEAMNDTRTDTDSQARELLSVLAQMFRNGGNITKAFDFDGVYGDTADGIEYGVVQHNDGSWGVHS